MSVLSIKTKVHKMFKVKTKRFLLNVYHILKLGQDHLAPLFDAQDTPLA